MPRRGRSGPAHRHAHPRVAPRQHRLLPPNPRQQSPHHTRTQRHAHTQPRNSSSTPPWNPSALAPCRRGGAGGGRDAPRQGGGPPCFATLAHLLLLLGVGPKRRAGTVLLHRAWRWHQRGLRQRTAQATRARGPQCRRSRHRLEAGLCTQLSWRAEAFSSRQSARVCMARRRQVCGTSGASRGQTCSVCVPACVAWSLCPPVCAPPVAVSPFQPLQEGKRLGARAAKRHDGNRLCVCRPCAL